MAKRITKKERADLVRLGRERAEYATVELAETDIATSCDVIEFPEGYASMFYPYATKDAWTASGFEVGCPARFAIFKAAFVRTVNEMHDEDRVR